MSLDVLMQRRGHRAVRIGRNCMSDVWHEVDDALLAARAKGLPETEVPEWGDGTFLVSKRSVHRKQWRDYTRARRRWCKVYPGEEATRLLPYIADDLDGDSRWFRPEALAEPWDWLWISW